MIGLSPVVLTERNSSADCLFFWPENYLGSEKIRANWLEGVEVQDKRNEGMSTGLL